MLTEEQRQELYALVSSLEAQQVAKADIQIAVDARKAEMLAASEEVKTEAVVEDEIAPAMAETVNTELQSAPGLSELPVDEDQQFLDQSIDPPKEKDLTVGEALSNAYNQMPGMLYQSSESLAAYYYQMTEEFGMRGIENQGFGVGANVGLTSDQKELKENQTSKIDNAFDKEKTKNIENVLEARRVNELLYPTGKGIVEGFKQGDLASIVGGAANGLASVLTSAVPAMVVGTGTTFATGNPILGAMASGAAMASQIAPQFFVDFNTERAKIEYPDLPEIEAVEKLFEENKEQVAVPNVLAGIATGFELAGFQGMSGAIAGSLAKKGSVDLAKAMLALGGKNGIINKTIAKAPKTFSAGFETLTEVGQLPLELANQAEAKKLKGDDFTNYVWENFKEQAPETIAQSFVGSRIFVGGGSTLRKAVGVIRDHSPVHTRGTASNSLFDLGVLKQRESIEKDPTRKKGMQDAIKIVEGNLIKEVKRGNKLARKLTDEQADGIVKANELVKKGEQGIETLKEQREAGVSDDTTYKLAYAGFQGDITNGNNKISETLNKVADESAKNIRDENGKFTEEYKNTLEKIRKSIYQKPETSKNKLNNKLNKEIVDLENLFKAGVITEKQYNADFSKIVQKYESEVSNVKKVANNIKANLRGIKGTSIKASEDLTQAFDDGVKDGSITKDENNNNVFKDKVFSKILKTQEAFLKKISNTVYNNIPKDLRIGSKQEYESNLKDIELLDLLRTYDGSSPLGAYLQKLLPLRAVSERALEGISNQEFQADLESNSVQGMISEENSETSPDVKNINTSKALGISQDLMNVIKNVAKKALVTSKQSVDSLKFKTELARSFKNDLYKRIKTELGLKDTKTNKGLTNAIEANPDAFYDTLSVEAMRKARGKDVNGNPVNPFEVAGFLKFNTKTGQLEKQSIKELGVKGLIKYMTNPDIANNTRSDRQMHLVEALATSMAAREAINLLENDIEFRQRFAEQQLEQQNKESFNKAADKIEDIPKGFTKKLIDQLKKISFAKNINQVTDLLNINKATVNDSNRLEKQEQMEAAIIASEIPSWMFEGSKFGNFARRKVDGVYVDLPARGGLYYGTKDPAYKKALKLAKTFDNKYNVKKPKRVNVFKAFTSEGKAQGKINLKALEFFANKLANSVAENKMSVEIASLFVSSGYQATTGIIKIAAPFRYKSKIMEYGFSTKQREEGGKEKFREEHNPPASVIGATLIWAIANNKVVEIMPYIKKNYYQTQLSKRDDERIDIAKLDSTLPEGFSILDNPIVRLAKAGTDGNRIDLNSIVNPFTGKTIAEENNVESASTPDAVAASNAAVIANNTDQVENLIDRAIAKLTELTGTDGTLQVNLAAIPVGVLIGGLRATKLAYQGGKALGQAIADGYSKVKNYMSAAEWADFASKTSQEVRNQQNPDQVRLAILNEKGIAQIQEQVRQGNYNLLKEFGINIDGLTTNEIINKLNILRKAKTVASNSKAPVKKARVFDFDDTLAKTNSKVLYTLPDGTNGSLDATQFAEQFSELKQAGATFDYSEFSQVKDGSKGPLATLAKKFTEAKGERDVFVLTARPADSALAIQEFLRSTLGISIPLQNITGLANGEPGAKAMWIAEKVSEGYNDVFFADDVAANVQAVTDMLSKLGVTKKVQQAKEDGVRSLEDEMDSLIRGKKRSKIGKLLSRFNIYIPPGADDFAGLLKYFQAKGKLGDEQMKWFQDNLLTPFAKGISAYTTAKVTLASDFKALNKRFKNTRTLGVPTKFRKMLSKDVLGGLYTNEQAVRAYLYDKAGQDLGLNKADTQDLIALVEGNAELKAYAQALSEITKLDAGYPPITEQWLGGSISTDMAVVSNKAQRSEFLQEFNNNKNQIFSDQNMKLIKQQFGNDYADALSNILERMETGQNRKKGKDKEFNSAMNWINQSVGAVMAVNMRSAILQQMSIVNYMNWDFNNPIKMGIAMANVPQFMKDYMMILNSDFLKERRGGMAIDVNLSDIADSNPGNLFLRLNKKVLEAGFKPTQWGDSNAIAFGGATWYRNRYNQLIKDGMSESDATAQAMLEFQEVSETAQQSSRVDKVSRQQASDIGRLILAFANTPLQYARETRKATLDLVNGRGDWRTNASKILYYGVAQNLIFTALQQGLFALLLSDADDEEYEKTDKKLMYSLNSVADGILRGMGYAGAVVASLKNLGMEYYEQNQKRKSGERVYDGSLKLVQAGLTISPPISKKIGDIVEGQKFETWKQYKNDPFYQNFAYANYFSGLTNLPADRIFKKIENLKAAAQDSTEAWQSVFLSLGWSPYNVGVDIEYKNSGSTSRRNESRASGRKNNSRKNNSRKSVLNKGTTDAVSFTKGLPKGVLGQANMDGSIDIKPGMPKQKEKEVIAHEKKHVSDMKSGKLGYDDDFVYYNNDKHKRTNDDKIVYNGKKYLEGSSKLPWEKAANKVEQKVS